MTTAAKFTYIVALIVGLCLGFPWGFQKTMLAINASNDLQRLGAVAELKDFSYRQYKHTDPEHAKEALLMYVKFLEEVEKVKTETSERLDLGVAYTRLALLEDAAHNPAKSLAYMDKAKYWHRAGGGRDYPEEEMKTMLKEFDEHQQQ